MKLYHGTSEKVAIKVLTEGLRPRGEGPSTWDHTCPSRGDMVYLTNAYAPYFAMAASEEGEKWAIIEVDTDLLDEDLFRPDEDFLEQATRGQPWAPMLPDPEDSMEERTTFFRDNIDAWAHTWESSLDHLGNCAYQGAIPPEAITQITLYDPKDRHMLAMLAYDPSISLMNYQFCGSKYRALTKWFAGHDVSVHELDPFIGAMLQMAENENTKIAGVDERFKALDEATADRSSLTLLKG